MSVVHPLTLGMVQAYLIEAARGLILIDAGMPGYEKQVLRAITSLGCGDLRLIYITHAHLDHYGSAEALRRITGAPVAVHKADSTPMARGESPLGEARGRGRILSKIMPLIDWLTPLEPTTPDLVLKDGDRLSEYGLDATVLHTPGHTMGSSSLIVKERYAFVGDLLSGNRRPHAQRLFAQDWAAIARSLDRLKSKRPELIYTGHGKRPLAFQELIKIEMD